MKEKIEREILEKQKELIEAKTENLQSTKRIEELYKEALDAIKNYNGQNNIGKEESFDSNINSEILNELKSVILGR